MSDGKLEQMEKHLRAGRPDDAMRAAEAFAREAPTPREAGVEIARTAARVYRDLISPPVHLFVELAPMRLKGDVGTLVTRALGRLFKMTDEWRDKLWDVHTERLLREMRDWTRMRHHDSAAANVARLMALVPDEKKNARARLIGNVLATIINNQKEANQLVQVLARDPGTHFLTRETLQTLENARQKRFSEVGSMNIENLEREWTSVLTQACVDIKEALPSGEKTGDPDETALRDAGDIFRSILRAPLDEEQPDLFLDATLILVDFIGREQTTTGKLARVEQRTYNGLGITAKKTVLLTFQDIGRNRFFTRLYQGWAKEYVQTDSIKPIIEFMGALRTADFNDFLRGLKADRKVASAAGDQLSSALGSIGGEEAIDDLLGGLQKLVSKRRIETVDLRQAERIIASLGSMIRSPRTTREERYRVLDYMRTHIPEDLTQLSRKAALDVFTHKPGEQTEAQRHYAIRSLVRALWVPDPTTALHKGGERQESELGHRHEPAEALKKIGPHDIKCLVDSVDHLVLRYSGAYMAVAEVFEKINDRAFLPVLEKMLRNAMAHDDNAQSSYQVEYYWDTATQERRPITRDKIIAPIVFAIGTIGGPEAKRSLQSYRDMISTGRTAAPNAEIARFLDRFKDAEDAADEGQDPEEDAAPGFSTKPTEEDVRGLIRQISKGYLLSGKSTRRMKKVEALSRLGQWTPLEALDAVLDQLGDKDPMVVSAAISAAAEYAEPSKHKTARDLAINGCLDRLASKDPAMREGAEKALGEMGPARKEVKEKILAFAKHVDRREVKESLAHVLKTGSATTSGLASDFDVESSPGATGSDSAMESAGAKPRATSSIDKLELKRAYMQARKEWIQGGKKGDPPPPPPGLD